MPLPSTPQPVAPAAAPQADVHAYQQVGGLQAEHLLFGTPHQFAHLYEKIEDLLKFAQDRITRDGKSDMAAAAPYEPEIKIELHSYLDRLLMQFLAKESFSRSEDRHILVSTVINHIAGLGVIEPLWMDPRITEVMVNGPDDVYVEIEGRVRPVPGCQFRSQGDLEALCQRILAPLNRRVDPASPMADGRLPDGSRVNIVHQAIAPGGPLLTIRRFPETKWTLAALVDNGSVSDDMACELAYLVYHRASILVVGGTGSGKTSLLNALSSCIPRGERVVTVEDSLELQFHHGAHVAAMEGRPAGTSGTGEIRIRDLVKNALRMRPDRIVVGEVRDSAALDMLQAMNTGHEGSMTTVHANGPSEAMTRMSVLVAQGGEIPEDKVQWLIGDAVDVLVMQTRYEDGSRRVSGIYEVPTMRANSGEVLEPIPLWEWEQTGTTEDGKYEGHYVRRNEISEHLRRMRRLDQFERFTIADIRRFALEGA